MVPRVPSTEAQLLIHYHPRHCALDPTPRPAPTPASRPPQMQRAPQQPRVSTPPHRRPQTSLKPHLWAEGAFGEDPTPSPVCLPARPPPPLRGDGSPQRRKLSACRQKALLSSRLGLWHDKQITQPRREGSPLGRGWMEGQGQAEEEGDTQPGKATFLPISKAPSSAGGDPGLLPWRGPHPSVAQMKPSTAGPGARPGKQATSKAVPVLPWCRPGPYRLRNEGERPLPRRPTHPRDSCRLLHTSGPTPSSLRAFARWSSLSETRSRDLHVPFLCSCRSLLKGHLLREAHPDYPDLKPQPTLLKPFSWFLTPVLPTKDTLCV